MWEKIVNWMKVKTILGFFVVLVALVTVKPVLAEFLGPDRTRTESVSSCQINLKQCQYVEAKDDWNYKVISDWLCSNESKPWQGYSNSPSGDCSPARDGEKYWERDESYRDVIVTYPDAIVRGKLQNCTLNNDWCTTLPQLSITGFELVSGYRIIAIEGTLNGQNFACVGSTCVVPLLEGDNSFKFWALSSWGDSSRKGTLTATVDSQGPVISGTFSGSPGSNGWYSGPVTFDGSASDATSGLASFACTLDGLLLDSCVSVSVNTEGPHTLVLSASDNAGNTNLLNQSLSIDAQPPTLNASIQGTLGSNNWYNEARLFASATDPNPGSGLLAVEYNIDNTNWTLFPSSGILDLPEGKHALDIRAVDNVGHSSASSKSFWLDNAAPTITLNPQGTLGLENWYITNLDLSAGVSDSTSGIDIFEYALNGSGWTTYTDHLIFADGSHSISFWAQDKAGLVKQVDQSYYVDTRPPQIAGSLSGTPGVNGWYVSDVTLSASAADPTPGSGLNTFSYSIDNTGEMPYTNALLIPDGIHNIRLSAYDKAGLSYSTEQTVNVDTIRPSLNIATSLPTWNKGKLILSGTAYDNGSGLSKVEISTNSGQNWQATTGTDAWTYEWDTFNDSSGAHTVLIRVTDNAGLTNEQTLIVGVDNQVPKITLPASWLQWDTVTLDVWDDDSGLSEARIEISDPDGRWANRVIQLNTDQFPLRFKWDRRLGDNTVAPHGQYDVTVTALDQLGNVSQQRASIKIVIEILPPGPTSTPPPYSRIVSTSTPASTAAPVWSPTATSTTVVNIFGEIPPTAQSTPTSTALVEPRPTPAQTDVLDWLESIFASNSDSSDEATRVESFTSQSPASPAPETPTNLLWGTVAAAVVGVLSEYAAEERRRIEAIEAQKAAEEAEEEERRDKRRAQKMEKLEEQWAQEEAWEQARLAEEQAALDRRNDFMESKMNRIDAEDEARWLATQIVIEKREEEKKKAEELKAGLKAYYEASRQGQNNAAETETNWWEKAKSFIQESILAPLNEYVYEPIIEPVVETTSEIVANSIAWINNTVYQPYIAPIVATSTQYVQEELEWLNDNIYQPYIQPAVENTIEFVSEEISWINENIYQPYIQPALVAVNENIIQPYVAPVVNIVLENISEGMSWVNENIYEPYIEPVTSYLNEQIYQPILGPVVDDVSVWWQETWDEYGESVHVALDIAGFIPGIGEIADGINGLIYLGEGRYIDAATSAMSLIPILGDLAKTGKWGIELGTEVVEELTEKVVKEVTEELVEQVAQETVEEIVEEAAEETLEEVVQQVAKETIEETAEKTLKESGEELASKVVVETLETSAEKALKTELADSAIEKAADEIAAHAVKDATESVAATATETVSKTITENIVEKSIKQVDDEFVSAITEKYGADQVEKFLPMCERYGIDPYDILTRPPSEGQSLVGWVLGISDPNSPVNFALQKMDLTPEHIEWLLTERVIRKESPLVVLGYGSGCSIPYYKLAEDIKACNISLSAEDWAPFDMARANFWTDVNAPFLERAVDQRKMFLFNINKATIADPLNVGRFSLPELKLIELPGNDYIRVELGEYELFVPKELENTYLENLPLELLELIS